MGVLGLWKLLEPCGKPVPLESLEDKVLAVDVSIWLNQVLKGYRDGQNGTLPNAHLVGVFHRVCKLLTYRIKPVFVFDGGVPPLKQQTLAARRLKKASASQAADRTSQKLVQNLLRQEAMRAVLGAAAPLPLAVGTASRPDPFALPPAPPSAQGTAADSDSDTDSSDSEADVLVDRLQFDLHSFDFESDEFRNLAPQVKHDILSDLKDTRKQNSWGKLDQMPKDADNFSEFQMGRLLKRKQFQDSMDDVEAEITKRNTELLHMGIDLPGTVTAHSMASRAGTFLVLSQPGAAAAEKHSSDGAGSDGGGGAGEGSAVKTEAEAEDDDGDEGAMVDAADMMEYLAGTDLFGGGGTSGGGSAARVDRRIDELKRARRGAGAGAAAGSGSRRPAAETEADTAQVFSEMGKKYSNLYLKFSAQWLEDEKKADGKVKKDSPQKRKAPEPPKDPPPPKKATSKPEYARIPTLEEVTRDLAKIADARKKSRTGQFKKPSAPAPRHSSKSSKSSRTKPKGASPSTESSTTVSNPGVLTVSINPAGALPKDDLFGDVFTAPAADSDDVTAPAADGDYVGVMSDDVGVMSDSDESDEDSSGPGRAPEDSTRKDAPKAAPESGDGVLPGAAVRSFGAAAKERLEMAEDSGARVSGGVTGTNNGTAKVSTSGAGHNSVKKETLASDTGGSTLEERKHTETRSRDETSDSLSSSKPVPSDRDLSLNSTPRIPPGVRPADAKPTPPALPPSASSAQADLRRPSPSSSSPSFTADDEEDPDDPDVPYTSVARTASPLVLPVSPRRTDPDVAAASAATAASAGNEGEKEEDLPDSVWDGLDDADLPDPATASTTTTTASSSTSSAAASASAGQDEEPPDSVWDGLDDSELRGLAEELAREQMNLLEERGRQQRDAAGVSDDMYRDVQALLEQFGIPYVVAPKEAEAQCAFLEIAGLTEGTITDDSDIWLFGGRRVYKNFFNQKKFVECYQAGDIQGSLGLTRGQLVCVALLTGSDYTLGVESVGCVRALEILAEFPGEGLSGLHAFRRWWEAARAGTSAVAATPIRRSLAALKLTQGFPSEAVQSAYLEPEVDTSREPFSWATPDLDGLRHLAAGKFGWGGAHTETVLTPVLDRLKQKQGQRRLDSFFSPAYRRDAPVEGSRRLQEAVRKVRGDDPPPPPPPAPRTGAAVVAASGGEESESARLEALMDDGLDELLAAVEEPADVDDVEDDVEQDVDVDDVGPSGAGDWDDLDDVDGLETVDTGETDSQEAPSAGSSALPDVVPRRRAAPRVSRGARGGARSRGRGRARSSTITATVPDATPGPPASQRSGGSSRPAPVPAELAALDPVSRERVLLVRRLRDRANLVRAQIQQEDGPSRRPVVQRPSTRQVRAKMMETLLKHNPRLKLEREAEMRRRLGLPPVPIGRGRSCRDPAARREQNFADVLTAPDQQRAGEAAAAEGSQDSAAAPSKAAVTAEGNAPATGQSGDPTPADAAGNTVVSPATATAAVAPSVAAPTTAAPMVVVQTASEGRQTNSVSSAAATGGTASPACPAAGRGRRTSDAAPARRQSAADRLRQASDRPLPVLPAPAAAEEPPQKLMSERRQAEARRHAAELLRAAGGATGGRRRRAGGAAVGRQKRPVQRPVPGPRAGGLSESSDSD